MQTELRIELAQVISLHPNPVFIETHFLCLFQSSDSKSPETIHQQFLIRFFRTFLYATVFPFSRSSRFSRSSMLETMREDYVRTARAKGLSESLVVMRHAFKNSLIEIVTVAGLQIGGLLSGSVMAETVFSIPGLGRLLVDSIQMRDYKVVQALLLFFATEYILINLVVDVLYGVINPRVRYE